MLSPEQTREVQSIVWEADLALGRQDYRLAAVKIWDATAEAIKCVARERGWPHETYAEIYDAGRKISQECSDGRKALSELNFAESHYAHGQQQVFADYELVEDWDLAPHFIERILGHPARELR